MEAVSSSLTVDALYDLAQRTTFDPASSTPHPQHESALEAETKYPKKTHTAGGDPGDTLKSDSEEWEKTAPPSQLPDGSNRSEQIRLWLQRAEEADRALFYCAYQISRLADESPQDAFQRIHSYIIAQTSKAPAAGPRTNTP